MFFLEGALVMMWKEVLGKNLCWVLLVSKLGIGEGEAGGSGGDRVPPSALCLQGSLGDFPAFLFS